MLDAGKSCPAYGTADRASRIIKAALQSCLHGPFILDRIPVQSTRCHTRMADSVGMHLHTWMLKTGTLRKWSLKVRAS